MNAEDFTGFGLVGFRSAEGTLDHRFLEDLYSFFEEEASLYKAIYN